MAAFDLGQQSKGHIYGQLSEHMAHQTSLAQNWETNLLHNQLFQDGNSSRAQTAQRRESRRALNIPIARSSLPDAGVR